MTQHRTQAEQLVRILRRRPARGLSYLEMGFTGVSVSGWKRLAESAWRYLKPGEQLIRKVDDAGRVRFHVARAA